METTDALVAQVLIPQQKLQALTPSPQTQIPNIDQSSAWSKMKLTYLLYDPVLCMGASLAANNTAIGEWSAAVI